MACFLQGSQALVPQQAWIQNLTLRDNILFSKPFDERLYNEVLAACELKQDLNILPGGDMTEIGERVKSKKLATAIKIVIHLHAF